MKYKMKILSVVSALTIILSSISFCTVFTFADTDLTTSNGIVYDNYQNYIILKDSNCHFYNDNYGYCRCCVTTETGKYLIFANHRVSGVDYGSKGNIQYFGVFDSLEECVNAFNMGKLQSTVRNGCCALAVSITGCKWNYLDDYSSFNIIYSDHDIVSDADTSKVVFLRTPYRTKVAIVGGLTPEVILEKHNPLREIILILPLTLVVVVSLVGLRKGLRLLSMVLRGA